MFISEQIRLRSDLGLRDDTSFVTSANTPGLLLAPADNFVMSRYAHIPVTPKEEEELARRDAITKTLPSLENALKAAQPKTYSSLWFDQKAGGVVRVTGTVRFSMPTAEIKRLLPAGTWYSVAVVPYSNDELNQANSNLMRDWAKLNSQGIHMVSFSVNVRTGRLDVGITSASISGAENQLIADYGALLSVQRGALPAEPLSDRNYVTGRIFGGSQIYGILRQTSDSITVRGCTASTSAVGAYGYFVITAGHCGNHVPVRRGLWPGGATVTIGRGFNNGFYSTYGSATHCDCQAVGSINASEATNTVALPNNQKYAYKRLPASSDFQVGDIICQAGATFAENHGGDGIACGPITSGSTAEVYPSQEYENGGPVGLFDAFEFAAPGEPGDSGAPIGLNEIYLGVLSGRNVNNNNLFGSKSYYIQDITGASPIFSNP